MRCNVKVRLLFCLSSFTFVVLSLAQIVLARNPPLEYNTIRRGMNYRSFRLPLADPLRCQRACLRDPRCRAFTYQKPVVKGHRAACYLKKGVPRAQPNRCCISGLKSMPSRAPARPYRKKVAPSRRLGPPIGRVTKRASIRLELRSERRGLDFRWFRLAKPDYRVCSQACLRDPRCKAFTYIKPGYGDRWARCLLKRGVPKQRLSSCCVSGVKIEALAKAPAPARRPPNAMPGPRRRTPSTITTLSLAECRRRYQGKKQDRNSPLPACLKTFKGIRFGSAQARKNRGLSSRRIAAIKQFSRAWQQKVRLMTRGKGNRELLIIQRRQFQKQLQQNRALYARLWQQSLRGPKKIPHSQIEKLKRRFAVMAPLPRRRRDLSQARLRPYIKRVFMIPFHREGDDVLMENYIVMILGKNFGQSPGRVLIDYFPLKKEFARRQTRNRAFLLPYRGDWRKAWYDNLIIVRVPRLPEPWLSNIPATLMIYRSGRQAFKLSREVRLVTAQPGISGFVAAPIYGNGKDKHCAVMNGTLVINGSSFGVNPGKVYLKFSPPIRLNASRAVKRLYLLPGNSNWQKSWSDRHIFVKVPKVQGVYRYHRADLIIETVNGRKIKRLIPYGPRMVVTQIPGIRFAEFAVRQHTSRRVEKGWLLVSHDPDCSGWFDSGDKALDYYFRKKGLPPGCSIRKVVMAQIDPDRTAEVIKWAIEQGLDLVEDLLTEGPGALLKFAAKWFIAGLATAFDSEGGRYYVRKPGKPRPGSNMVSVMWKNTCAFYSPWEDVPVEYMITFFIWGPEDTAPGTKVR